MTLNPFDLTVAILVVVMMPMIIWVNYSKRDGGLQGYLWRESPVLMWTSLAFLSVIFLFSVVQLATHYGFFAPEAEAMLSIALGIPMLVMSLAILALGGGMIVKYLQARPGA
jgi:hypothetical protein